MKDLLALLLIAAILALPFAAWFAFGLLAGGKI